MTYFQTFQVVSIIPESLKFLETLSNNLWWCWQYEAVDLFKRIDPILWEDTERNPIKLLNYVPQERLEELESDDSFLAHMESVEGRYQQMIQNTSRKFDDLFGEKDVIAYFSMEFGIHESLPLFAGGLGILAGDHLKAASDHMLPLVGVGLMYREGYFRQRLNHDGWQMEEYPETEVFHLPVEKVEDAHGEELRISIDGPDGEIRAAIWKLSVGRIELYLLDTNLTENPPAIREITSRLYAGEARVRLAQEILLGVGGMRALAAIGLNPKIYHMNEGHCAFAGIERLRQTMEDRGIDFDTAMEVVPRSAIFTTHTPVAAGHDEFPVDMVRPYLTPFASLLGKDVEDVIGLGQEDCSVSNCPLSMFVLALRMSLYCNGVSKLHGEVARNMWTHVWPGVPEDELPISHVTNGVHVCSYMARENALIFDRFISPDWNLSPWDDRVIDKIHQIYDGDLWRAHETSRFRLIRMCRRKLVNQYTRRNAASDVMKEVETVLEQDVLTICFARRFATYKRANLLLYDPERLEKLITDPERPVQFVFAGKAHPKDDEGKMLIKKIVEFARKPSVRKHFVFIEDYDINVARYMVQGGDVWLNNPRRPLEACGTSGIKAALNGVLNLSIMDGWWCEGFSEDEARGWRIGKGESYEDSSYQDMIESQALYNVLENEVIPSFYDRKDGHLPHKWISMMKNSMRMAMAGFSSYRMVKDYSEKFYRVLSEVSTSLSEDNCKQACEMVLKRQRINSLWDTILVEPPVRHVPGSFRVGDTMTVTAIITLGKMLPDEVDVELYYGQLKSPDALTNSNTERMEVKESLEKGQYQYHCQVKCERSGRYGYVTRITPRGDKLVKYSPGKIIWASVPHGG